MAESMVGDVRELVFVLVEFVCVFGRLCWVGSNAYGSVGCLWSL